MTKVQHWPSCERCSDAHRRAERKNKHWEDCSETSQCLIPIIGMFFSNLPMVAGAFKLPLLPKLPYTCLLLQLFVYTMRYLIDSQIVKSLKQTGNLAQAETVNCADPNGFLRSEYVRQIFIEPPDNVRIL